MNTESGENRIAGLKAHPKVPKSGSVDSRLLPLDGWTAWGAPPKNRRTIFGGGERVRPCPEAKSRGYYKIKDAASAFRFDFRGKVVLDIGSSTGGFTKYALERGAKKVIAVEKGTNQMEVPFRFDPRIELHEKTDVFSVEVDTGFTPKAKTRFSQPEKREFLLCCENQKLNLLPKFPDVIVADVSFLSLTKILKYAKLKLARSDTDYLVMLKPQFEAKPHELKNGIVKNHQIRRQIVKNFETWLKQNGFVVIKKRDNTLKGKNGNEERFYWLKGE